jgi:3-hydroxyisobutyrate dehydrogenase
VIEVARQAGFDAPVGEQAAALFARACENGLATLDDASVFELMRKR